jgi:hypothetical protein
MPNQQHLLFKLTRENIFFLAQHTKKGKVFLMAKNIPNDHTIHLIEMVSLTQSADFNTMIFWSSIPKFLPF